MTQDLAMALLNRFVQALEDSQTFAGDARQHHAAILGFATARDKSTLFHTIEQPSDVGITSYHAICDLIARQALGGAPQNAQDVVLSLRQAFRFEDAYQSAGKQIGGAEKI